jgi:hypothetical protein
MDPFSKEAPGLGVETPDFDPRRHRDLIDEKRTAPHERNEDAFRPEYRPMADLPEPEPEAGFVFRYVRVSAGGVHDTRNIARRFAEGWRPVSATEQPKVANLLGRIGVNADGHIEIGGLMLCKLPVEIQSARTRYYQRIASDQLRAVDSRYLAGQDRRMPKLAPERSSYVTSGSAG